MSDIAVPGAAARLRIDLTWLKRRPTIVIGLALLALLALLAIIAPLITGDPVEYRPILRLKPPSETAWFGTDLFGRDVYARAVWGGRVSLLVGLAVSVATVAAGLFIGALAGFFPMVDAVAMRVMDGLMAIPGVLLAIALVTLSGASLAVVILAITIPEVPRMARLVRSVVLSVRTRAWVDAAVTCGCPTATLLWRHILPSTIPVVLVQATYVCSSAILVEAALSFLGAGTPPDIPSWGGMIAQARGQLQVAPWAIFFPSACLALTVLAVNLVGDGLRDLLDPRLANRI